MKKDGTLTAAERRTVESAMRIVGDWLDQHMREPEADRPYKFWDIYEADRAFCAVYCFMCEEY